MASQKNTNTNSNLHSLCKYHSTTRLPTSIPHLRLISFRHTGFDWVWTGLVCIYYTKETFIGLKGAFDMVFSVHSVTKSHKQTQVRRANEYIQLCQLILISDATL